MLKLMASSVHGAQIKEKQRKISIRSTYGVQFATIFFVSVRFKGPRMTAAPAVPLVSAVLGPPCNALWTITDAWVKGRYMSSNYSLQKEKLKHYSRANRITGHLILVRGLLATIPACWPIGVAFAEN